MGHGWVSSVPVGLASGGVVHFSACFVLLDDAGCCCCVCVFFGI